MNRRNFLRSLATGLAGFTILPGAGRVWRAQRQIVAAQVEHLVPFWFQTQPIWRCQSDDYIAAIERILNTPEARARMML